MLTVDKGAGGGNFGAGSVVTLTADAPAAGKYFIGWTGGTVANPTAPTTTFIMPTSSATVTAQFAALPSPTISGIQIIGAESKMTITADAFPNLPWVLLTSTNLVDWQTLTTNLSTAAGIVQFTKQLDADLSRFFKVGSP